MVASHILPTPEMEFTIAKRSQRTSLELAQCVFFHSKKYSDEKLANVSDVAIFFDEDVKDDKIDISKISTSKMATLATQTFHFLTFIYALSP